jgi:hypothetical protein
MSCVILQLRSSTDELLCVISRDLHRGQLRLDALNQGEQLNENPSRTIASTTLKRATGRPNIASTQVEDAGNVPPR